MRTVCQAFLAVALAALPGAAQPVGIFEAHQDVGVNPKGGSIQHNPATGEYSVTGGGANVWGAEDAFHFAWKRVTGDFVLSANVRFNGTGTHLHRKAMLMVRQDLTAGSAYADAALHGDGLTSLQFRPAAGEATQEIRSTAKAPVQLRIERRGNQFTITVAEAGQAPVTSGPQAVALTDPVYAGIGVSSHNVDVLETAVFSDVKLEALPSRPPPPRYRSKITIFDLASRTSRTVYTADEIFEAPNWSRDGKFLLVNGGGSLYRLPVEATDPKLDKIDLGGAYRCNNDHDFSRDGKLLAFSASSPSSRQSQVYVANADGSQAKLLTPAAPSYFHGWSPDGKWLAFVGQRNGKYELFRVSVNGGAEERLTSKGAYDDGPEYTPDGKWIYFNSNRSGRWEVWRMPPGGAGDGDKLAEQITNDDPEDWFPHFSPNGKRMLVFAFPKGTAGHGDRMAGVVLRLAPAPGKNAAQPKFETLATFFGGQGTINVNSWSPDSKRFAYVVYEPLPPR